jgi:hypothetical protein
MTIVKFPARTLELWDSLVEFPGAASLNVPWPEVVRVGSARGIVGEVILGALTSAEDWKLVPSGPPFKGVDTPNGRQVSCPMG